jgi:hypothetical protein
MSLFRNVRAVAAVFAVLSALSLALAPARLVLAAKPGERIVFIGRESASGYLIGIEPEWKLKFQIGDKQTVVPAGEVAFWGRYHDVETGPQILLRDGSILRADLLDLSADAVTIGDATGLGRCLWDESALPRSAVRGVLLQPPVDALARDKMLARIASYALADDQLLLIGGESVSGRLIDAPRGGRFLPEGEKSADVYRLARPGMAETLDVPTGKVVAVFLGGAGRVTASRGAVQLGFSDGSLIAARQVAVAGDAVRFDLEGGGTLTAPLDQADEDAPTLWRKITWGRPGSERVKYLSDLQPLGYKHIPLLTLEWPFGQDRNVLGGRLRSGGAIYPKGLGMHTVSRLAYNLDGKYRRFEGELALDDAAQLGGSVTFKVLVERTPNQWASLYESPAIRGGDAPVPISLDVQGARRIALIVDYAYRADELDHANWLMARLVE